MTSERRVVAMVGATASGKTAVAVAVAQYLDVEVVSADSRQVRAGMVIGTAAPTPAEQAAVRHHLVGHVPVDASYTLADWLREARVALADISGVWAPAQKAIELHDDVQAIANGYIDDVAAADGSSFPLVVNPVQFDEAPTPLVRAPETGEHTDEILAEIGLDWERIVELKVAGAVL